MPEITKDGKLSSRRSVPDAVLRAAGSPRSDFLGYFDYRDETDRTKLICRLTSWTGRDRHVYEAALPFINEVNAVFKAVLPHEFQIQLAEA